MLQGLSLPFDAFAGERPKRSIATDLDLFLQGVGKELGKVDQLPGALNRSTPYYRMKACEIAAGQHQNLQDEVV